MSTRPPEEPWSIRSDGCDRVEENEALALGNYLRDAYEEIKKRLPPGTHFAVIIDIPGTSADPDGRIATLSTERNHMARLAAQWSMDILGRPA